MKKIGILYICTGKYTVFWNDFYQSSEKYFLANGLYEKHYYIFTDSKDDIFPTSNNIHIVFQEPLPWPYITLDRFKIFQKARTDLEQMDYIYFFNANMQFIDVVNEEILPTHDQPLVMVKHPGFFNKERDSYPYDNNVNSLAHVSDTEGEFYVMGGVNGGRSKEYLELITELEHRINIDKENGIIAIWHDESHLNRYAIDKEHAIKLLDPSYGYAENWNLPVDKKIVIRDKHNYGGHAFLRNENNLFRGLIQKMTHWFSKK